MKRIPALKPLSMEHHLSLSLAVKAMRTARGNDTAAKQALCARIGEEYPTRWRPHFDAEERCLFGLYADMDPELERLYEQLTDEHDRFDAWVEAMKQGDCSVLEAFGELLQSHTRLEERRLFERLAGMLSDTDVRLLERCLNGHGEVAKPL